MTTNTQRITFGEMRESGVRDVLIYRRDHRRVLAGAVVGDVLRCNCRAEIADHRY